MIEAGFDKLGEPSFFSGMPEEIRFTYKPATAQSESDRGVGTR